MWADALPLFRIINSSSMAPESLTDRVVVMAVRIVPPFAGRDADKLRRIAIKVKKVFMDSSCELQVAGCEFDTWNWKLET